VVLVPVTRSDLVVFSAGLALGAVAYATYPRWKGKVSPFVADAAERLGPLLSAAVAGASAAYADATAAAHDAPEQATPAAAQPAATVEAPSPNGAHSPIFASV
jgi:hypothetical protein